MKPRISISGGLQPNPPRDDIGGALVKEIDRSRSSYPLCSYMNNRLDALARAAGFSSYFDFKHRTK